MSGKDLKVLLAASECAPLVKTCSLGDMIGSLSKELSKLGVDARVVLPLYKGIDVKKYKIKPIFRGKKLNIRKNVQSLGLWSSVLPQSKVPVYLVESRKYLWSGDWINTAGLLAGLHSSKEATASHRKEILQFAFFSEAVSELLRCGLLPFTPAVVHMNDWHTGSLAALIRRRSEQWAISSKRKRGSKRAAASQGLGVDDQILPPKVVFTIHNLWDQGVFRDINYMEMGIRNADVVTTVSPTYAEEIQTKEYGFSLHTLLKKRKPVGILNGLDSSLLLPLADKNTHKLSFQEKHGLRRGSAYPLFGVVSGLYEQKGIQWVIPIVSCMTELFGAQFAFLGAGDDEFEGALLHLAREYPQNVFVRIGLDEKLAQEIYAASDFSLMPSVFEPCGFSQMISMHYGTLPIARATGGLKDTIVNGKAGFLFEEGSERALLQALYRALDVFTDEVELNYMRECALREDWSWGKSAAEYKKLYKNLAR